MTTTEAYKQKAFEQFIRRFEKSEAMDKIRNGDLHAGEPMYFYCHYCGIPTEVLPEDYLFTPYHHCSQCAGLEREGLLQEAIRENGCKTPTPPRPRGEPRRGP